MLPDPVFPTRVLQMRWFGDAWQAGTDAERSRAYEDYRLHLASLAPSLPASFLLLVEGGGSISLHDGHILSVFQEKGDDDSLCPSMSRWAKIIHPAARQSRSCTFASSTEAHS